MSCEHRSDKEDSITVDGTALPQDFQEYILFRARHPTIRPVSGPSDREIFISAPLLGSFGLVHENGGTKGGNSS